MRVILAMAVLAGIASAQYHAQCAAPYKTLSSFTRNVNFNDGNGNVEVCDSGANGVVNSGSAANNDWQGAGWYRFTGAAGTEMPTTPAGEYACGGDSSSFLNGVHPAPADGVVSREVCFGFFHRPCAWTIPTSVVACNGFFLYNLAAPPALCLRYCGATPAAQTAEVASGAAPAGQAAAGSSGHSFWPMPGIFIVLGVLAAVGVVVGVVVVRRQSAAAATAAAASAGVPAAEPEWDDTLYVTAAQEAVPVANLAAEVDMDAAVPQLSALSRSSDV